MSESSLIKNLRASVKLALFGLTVSAYLLTSAIFYPLTFINPFFARKFLTRVISFYCRIGLWFMGVKVETPAHRSIVPNSFLVCNHLGYLDVLVLASKVNACFVTSLEMRRTPFLGQICEMGGCLYVDRRTRANLSKEVSMLTQALASGLNVCVFPEGTSTNGSSVLRFKRPLFKAAVDSAKAVQTLCLNYEEIDGGPLNSKNRDSLFWYGDMTFLPHLWNFFRNKSVKVSLTVGPVLRDVQDYSALSVMAHQAIAKEFRPVPTEEAGLELPLPVLNEVGSFLETHPQ